MNKMNRKRMTTTATMDTKMERQRKRKSCMRWMQGTAVCSPDRAVDPSLNSMLRPEGESRIAIFQPISNDH